MPARALLAMRDSQGREIEEYEVPQAEPVLSPDTAYLVSDILADNAARTFAFGANSPLSISRPAAAKTGTTTDYRDNWTVGYTPYLVAGVWAGNSDGHPMRDASGVTGAAPIWHTFMEAVLADDELVGALQTSSARTDWWFEPPRSVVEAEACPPDVDCRSGGELFRQTWIDQAGRTGPLADSVVRAPTAPVIVQQGELLRLGGFCELEGAAERTLLQLPHAYGLPDAEKSNEGLVEVSAEASRGPGDEERNWTLDQLHALAWSLENGTQTNFGPCDQLADVAPRALALNGESDEGVRVLVDVANAGNPELQTLSADGAVELAVIQKSGGERLSGPGTYWLAEPIVNDFSCPGQYVMGQVVNLDGAPVAGVRIVMRDPWGNEAQTLSKNGANDFGMFDFPIYADGSHDLTLTVVDESGNALSGLIVVPHRRDGASDTPCHMVRLQGG